MIVEGAKMPLSVELPEAKPGEMYRVALSISRPDGSVTARYIDVRIIPRLKNE